MKDNKEYIYVLDYVTDRIIEIEINSDDDVELVIGHLGINFDDCNYLVSKNKLELETYKYPEDV